MIVKLLIRRKYNDVKNNDLQLEEELKEDVEEDDDEERIQISTEPVDLSGFDVIDDSIGKVSSEDILLNDIEAPPPL